MDAAPPSWSRHMGAGSAVLALGSGACLSARVPGAQCPGAGSPSVLPEIC